jgi:hypothetical protein
MSRNAFWILGGLVLVTVFGVQFNQIRHLKSEVEAVRAELGGPAVTAPEADKDGPAIIPNASAAARPNSANSDGTAGIQMRLASLERAVADFTKAADVLMDRGMIPPSEEKLAELNQKFFDPNTSDDERLKILGMLRRHNNVGDDVALHSLSMMQNSTNLNFKRAMLGSLNGLTNAALKQPLFAMLQSETSDDLRAQLVNSLRSFTDDPAIESKLWDLALNDPNKQVRDRARDAVTRGAPVTPERIDRLSQTAHNENAPLDERLLSFRALRLAKAHTPEMVNEFLALALNTTDPVAKAKLFGSFNGLTDPQLMAPLVTGLQDTDPVVRQNAVDALSSFPDPRVEQWIEHMIKNDPDPAVVREAHKAKNFFESQKVKNAATQGTVLLQ